MKYFLIFLVLVFPVLFFLTDNSAFGLCMIDEDWPDKPCCGRRHCDPEIEQQKKDWEGYYSYKGDKWMQEQKKIMMEFIEHGTLSSWLYHKSEFYTDSNHNVWNYYYLQGEVPRENGKYLGEFDYPYQQGYEKFFEHSYLVVQCNEGLTLVLKNVKQTPACVRESTGNDLVLRGWGNFVKTMNVIDTESDILYDIRGGKLVKVIPKFNAFENNISSIEFALDSQEKGLFSARIPSELINTNPNYWIQLVIQVDGVVIEPEYFATGYGFKLFSVPITEETSKIKVTLPEI